MKGAADTRDVAIGLAVVCGRAGVTAGKVALVPLRVVARAPVVGSVLGRAGGSLADTGRTARAAGREQLAAVTGDVLASPEAERTVDAALASPLPEAVARVVVERQVVQRVVEEVLASARLDAALGTGVPGQVVEHAPGGPGPGLEQLVAEALQSAVVTDITNRVIESPELQRVIEEVASSPAVRSALTRQTSSFAEELARGLRVGTGRLDDRAERLVRRHKPAPPAAAAVPTFGGLAARGIAFGIDLAITLVIFLAGTAVGALLGTLVGGFRPLWLAGVVAAIGWSFIVGVYLVTFWTLTGQTPGMRVMHLRVLDERGRAPRLGRSLVRLVGLFLAIVPLCAGFIPVLFDGRRRALQDYLAGTAVHAYRTAPDALPAVVA